MKPSVVGLGAGLILGATALSLIGCAAYENRTGVENRWRDPGMPPFTPGETTRAEVIDNLGPPSQLINLDDGIVLYYLNEVGSAFGYVTIIYNKLTEKTLFDRAIFFFDDQGVLTDFALSEERNPRGDDR
jgi:hypothetical protein